VPGVLVDDQFRVGEAGAAVVVDGDSAFRVSGRAAMQDDGAFDHWLVAEVTA
jgi:hypothetical protein